MRIVLPGALPDPREAGELTSYLHENAPTLARWLELGRARSLPADPAQTGCTPYETWQLREQGFQPEPGQNFATGLGPLRLHDTAERANVPPEQAVWMVELVHVSPSRDGAALLPAADLAITPEQSVALFESAEPLFAEVGFGLHRSSLQHWRIDLPDGYSPVVASPVLVSLTSVNDWWPQGLQDRPWRRLVNEVQMLWFDHPANQARYELGQMPVNSLWLFGGARPDQLTPAAPDPDTQVHAQLLAYSTTHDWGGWLAALKDLEARVFRPLSGQPMPELILTGSDRIVQLSKPARWRQWLPVSRNAWSNWWSSPN
ncbi:hypothetical protein H0A64_08880 [Alcaligenaceae bacterium]|nr:hypothetical protein [Alcaligenaceae bacterium]